MTKPAFHPGLAALADRYDAFIVDLWGVMHDGIAAFPEAVEALGIPAHATGYLADREALADMYRAADVLLMPSTEEAFGLVS